MSGRRDAGAPGVPSPEPLDTPRWMLTARPVVALLMLVALALAALLPGDDAALVASIALLAVCFLFAVHLGNLNRPDYTRRGATIMLGLMGVFALAGLGRLAWSVFLG